ncbi:MAG: 30S ribosomal protein S9 [Patescibacteria group bacterium]
MATTEETKETKKRVTKSATPRVRKPKAEKVEEEAEVVAVETVAAAVEPVPVMAPGTFIRALGRRKTAIARVRMATGGKGSFVVNGKPGNEFFKTFETRLISIQPLKATAMETAMDISALVNGGGPHAQAEAVRLGIARALCALNPAYRKVLKKLGYLTRDPRAKERKKPGLKRARRAPQWSKR